MIKDRATLTRYFALLMGIAFLLAGIGGFLPSITITPAHDAPDLTIEISHGRLIGLYPVNLLHNIVHLILAAVGLWAWRNAARARWYARGVGVFLALLTVMGLLPGFKTVFGLMPLHGHDVWLHAFEALAGLYLGFYPQPAVSES
jgi:hypothetical protein